MSHSSASLQAKAAEWLCKEPGWWKRETSHTCAAMKEFRLWFPPRVDRIYGLGFRV